MLTPGTDYDSVVAAFRWRVPERYNIAVDVCDRHAASGGVAMIVEDESGAVTRHSFQDLARLSNRLANALRHLGIGRGDRVAVLLSQGPELAIAHLASYKLGAIVLPLFALFGPDAKSSVRFCIAGSAFRAPRSTPGTAPTR